VSYFLNALIVLCYCAIFLSCIIVASCSVDLMGLHGGREKNTTPGLLFSVTH